MGIPTGTSTGTSNYRRLQTLGSSCDCPGSFRNFTNSTKGCPQCKQRRVKCDETLPHCKKCASRSVCVPQVFFYSVSSTNYCPFLAALRVSGLYREGA
jgi:hypothetical protein